MIVGGDTSRYFDAMNPRFFYGFRRTDDGELYLAKLDQSKKTDVIEINTPGDSEENYPTFEEGIDYIEGRDENHEIVYENLNYEQFRWDERNLLYYIDDDGQLVVRINQSYVYPTGI